MTSLVEQHDQGVAEAISSFNADQRAMGDAGVAALSPTRRKRVLMLTHRMPYPPDRGDRIRSYHLLKLLRDHFDMAIACTSDEPAWLQHHQLLSTIAKRVELQPITPVGAKLRGVGALLRGKAVTPATFYRHGLAAAIERWHEQAPFDAVLTFCTGMIQYARLLTQQLSRRGGPRKRTDVRHVLDLVDVDSEKWVSYARNSYVPMKWVYNAEAKRLREIEAGRYDEFDAVTVVSETEADCYRRAVGPRDNLHVVGNGVDMKYFSPQPEAESNVVVFVGVLDYKPNYDGVEWFVEKVMPKLRKKSPSAEFHIVGRNPTAKVMHLGMAEGVKVVGSVPDVRAHLAEAAAVIAPLRIARGVQNKVLEAMSCRRAVVCSPGAAEGIDATHGEHLLVADSPDQWADALHRLLTDKPHRAAIAAAARTRIEQRYTWEEQLKPMIDLLKGDEESEDGGADT